MRGNPWIYLPEKGGVYFMSREQGPTVGTSFWRSDCSKEVAVCPPHFLLVVSLSGDTWLWNPEVSHRKYHCREDTTLERPWVETPEREVPEDRELHLLQLRRHTWEGRASEMSLVAPELWEVINHHGCYKSLTLGWFVTQQRDNILLKWVTIGALPTSLFFSTHCWPL